MGESPDTPLALPTASPAKEIKKVNNVTGQEEVEVFLPDECGDTLWDKVIIEKEKKPGLMENVDNNISSAPAHEKKEEDKG